LALVPAAPRPLLRLRSDAVLAERFAAGDEAAFATLYERHRASVLAVCMGVLGSRHDAEDAAQEAFAALAVCLTGSPPRELRAWLARVARNAAIDVARRRRSTVSTDDTMSEPATHANGMKAELESVLAGIRELPEAQRTALLMRELGGHSYLEIGALLEVDEEAVRGLIARARVGLRRHREASEMPCASAREALAAEPDGRRHNRTVRRHVRSCASCRAYRAALRGDARALRGLQPFPVGGLASGGAVVGGLAAKGALLGGTLTQVTAACAVSVCAVGGLVLLSPHEIARHLRHRNGAPAIRHTRAAARSVEAPTGTSASAFGQAQAVGASAASSVPVAPGGGQSRATSGSWSVTNGPARSTPGAKAPGQTRWSSAARSQLFAAPPISHRGAHSPAPYSPPSFTGTPGASTQTAGSPVALTPAPSGNPGQTGSSGATGQTPGESSWSGVLAAGTTTSATGNAGAPPVQLPQHDSSRGSDSPSGTVQPTTHYSESGDGASATSTSTTPPASGTSGTSGTSTTPSTTSTTPSKYSDH
jgi:RNA polymerase sigma factor (sigma-70 family)